MLRLVLFLSFAFGVYQTAAAGTIRVANGDCQGLAGALTAAAQFSYQSSLPEFGNGQFPLTRLAFESAVNCGD